MPDEPTTLMASAEVCEAVGIDRSTLSRYVTSGRIHPAMRLPGRTGAMLFHPEDADLLKDWYYGERLATRAEPTEAA